MKLERSAPNRVLLCVAALVLFCTGCVSALEDALRQGGEGITVVFSQDDGPEGAERIRIAPEGDVHWERWRPSFVGEPAAVQEVSYFEREADVSHRGTLDEEERDQLRRLLIEIEAWRVQVPENFGPLDGPPLAERRATLRLEGHGETVESWQWSRDVDTDPRLSRIRVLLRRLVVALAHRE